MDLCSSVGHGLGSERTVWTVAAHEFIASGAVGNRHFARPKQFLHSKGTGMGPEKSFWEHKEHLTELNSQPCTEAEPRAATHGAGPGHDSGRGKMPCSTWGAQCGVGGGYVFEVEEG